MKIAILDDYQHVALASADWATLPPECDITVFDDNVADEDALVERLRPFQIVCAMRERTPLRATLIRRLPNLKLIVSTGMRNASIDVAAANERGIVVCGTRSSGPATAELTMALLLAVSRNLIEEVDSVRAGGWQKGLARGLAGATLGIIGLGKLGSRVAECAKVFGMDLIAWSQNLTAEKAAAAGARLVSKEELLSQADYVTLHVVLSERSRGLIGERELSLMKPHAALINTSRGPIVDTDALIEALERGRPAVAALDVFDMEPLPLDSPLRKMPNVIPTPHIGYVTQEAYQVYFTETVEDIVAFLEGSPVRVMSD